MFSGKAVARSLRAHMLVQGALVSHLINALVDEGKIDPLQLELVYKKATMTGLKKDELIEFGDGDVFSHIEKMISEYTLTKKDASQNIKHAVRRSGRFWAGLWSDLVIEQTLMRSIKSSGSLTRGRGFEENVRHLWVSSISYTAAVHEAMSSLSGVKASSSEHHAEMEFKRRSRDYQDCEKFFSWFESRNPFNFEDADLHSLSTGSVSVCGTDNVNCENAESIGECIQKSIDEVNFTEAKIKKKDQLCNLNMMTSSIKIGRKNHICVNPTLLFTRLAAIAQREEDVEQYFDFELTTSPQSLFKNELMRKPNKASLRKVLLTEEIQCSANEVMEITGKYVLDGGALLHRVHWVKGIKFNEVAKAYVNYIRRNYGSAFIVFDGYDSPESIKSNEHLRRAGSKGSTPNIIITEDNEVLYTKERFLSNSHNKTQLISFLADHLTLDGQAVHICRGDADTKIVSTALEVAAIQLYTIVVADDTDVAVMLLYHWNENISDVFFLQERGKKCWSIRKAQLEVLDFKEHLLLSMLGLAVIQPQLYSEKENQVFLISYSKYLDMICKGVLQPEKLPPTERAAYYHGLRVHVQVIEWQMLDEASNLDPKEWGWKSTDGYLTPITTDKEITPKELLKVIRCNCKTSSKNQCGTNICTYRKHGLKCMPACGGCQGESCSNKADLEDIDMSDDDTDGEDGEKNIIEDLFKLMLSKETITGVMLSSAQISAAVIETVMFYTSSEYLLFYIEICGIYVSDIDDVLLLGTELARFPLETSFISKSFFWWMTTLMLRGYKEPLKINLLSEMDDENKCETIGLKFEELWNVEVENSKIHSRPNKEISPSTLKILFRYFYPILLYSTVIQTVALVFSFGNPLFLNLMIQFSTSNEEVWKGVLYSFLIFLSTAISTTTMENVVNYDFVIGMKLKSALISMIYKKCLRVTNQMKQEWSAGDIVNLMSVDTQRIAETANQLFVMWQGLFQITVSVILLSYLLGPAVITGIVILLINIPINSIVTKFMQDVQRECMKHKDERTSLISELLNGIKILKLYAWELPFGEKVNNARDAEIHQLKKFMYLYAVQFLMFVTTPYLVALGCFTTYLFISDLNILTPTVIFVSLSLLNIMRIPMMDVPYLFGYIIQALESMKRIDSFMKCEEIDTNNVTFGTFDDDHIRIIDGNFKWKEGNPCLTEINMNIQKQQLVAVVGSVGSGKSSLLAAILGDLIKESGQVIMSVSKVIQIYFY
ncbi:Multidrug resistance-associated protein 1 [Nymphon striatum]|nr:Multidrug resistance-associated protein 1 [Nymphon striatum]